MTLKISYTAVNHGRSVVNVQWNHLRLQFATHSHMVTVFVRKEKHTVTAKLTVGVGDTIRIQSTYRNPLFLQKEKTFTEIIHCQLWALRLTLLELWSKIARVWGSVLPKSLEFYTMPTAVHVCLEMTSFMCYGR